MTKTVQTKPGYTMTGLKIKDFEKFRAMNHNKKADSETKVGTEAEQIITQVGKNIVKQHQSIMDKINDHTSISTTKTGTKLRQPTRSSKPLVIAK
jgi:hypothetical protein